ncbi:MAG TPA: hypothetical protein VF768_07095 [Holophagaceae bacterium]
MHRTACVLGCTLLAVSVSARAQGVVPPLVTAGPVTPKLWSHLRVLVSQLGTEEGTRTVFLENPGLGDAFSSLDTFDYFIKPWRTRLVPLPATLQEARHLDLDLDRMSDGTSICRITFHHPGEARAITIMKTVWRGEHLVKLEFLKGFVQAFDRNARRGGYPWRY